MKILYINSLYPPYSLGGAGYSLQVLVEVMQKRDHEVVVLTTSDQKGIHQDNVNGIKVYRAGIENKYWYYNDRKNHSNYDKICWHLKDIYNQNMGLYLQNILAMEKPDIVSCHNLSGWSIAVWDILYNAKIPIVQVLHDFYLLCINSNMFKNGYQCEKRCISCKLARYPHLKKSKNINAVVGISQYVLEKVIDEGYFEKSIKKVIYNARIIPDLATDYSVQENSNIVFGFMGTIAPNKGVQWLIEQFIKVDSNKIELKIAGKGSFSYVNLLNNISKNDKRISFIGYTKPEDFYSQIDMLIVPSLWDEPLGMVAIEACAYHIPVITTAKGGLKEIIIDGYNGLYCSMLVPDSLSIAIHKISNDKLLLSKLKEQARDSVLPFLNLDRLASEYESIYRQII
jgi:glycosyltransferase involved in cell wall biosynthesis